MIEDLIEKFTIKTEKTIHFTTDLKTEKVYADEEFLKEAISNLIDNAIKIFQRIGKDKHQFFK